MEALSVHWSEIYVSSFRPRIDKDSTKRVPCIVHNHLRKIDKKLSNRLILSVKPKVSRLFCSRIEYHHPKSLHFPEFLQDWLGVDQRINVMVFLGFDWITHDMIVEDVVDLLQLHHSTLVFLMHYHD